jgi:hypothetical protein
MDRIHLGMRVVGPDGRTLGRVSGFDECSVIVGRRRRQVAVNLEEVADVRGDRVRLTSRTDTLLHQYTRGQAAVGLDTLVH